MWVYLFCIVCLLGWTAISDRRKQYEKTPAHDRESLKLLHLPLQQQLSHRALANKAFGQVFNLDNPFTSDSRKLHDRFIRLTVRLMRDHQAPSHWIAAATMAFDFASRQPSETPLRTLVHQATLKITVCHILGYQGSEDGIPALVDYINQTWVDLKNGKEQMGPAREVCELLKRVGRSEVCESYFVQDQEAYNALNLIIPIYESTSRLAFLLLLAILRLPVEDRQLFASCCSRYQASGTIATFTGVQTSLLDHINEGLRLYPPVKRLHRSESESPCSIDIEARHHSADIWGSDVLAYKPARMQHLSKEQQEAFIPFSIGPIACPAHKGFAPMLIASIISGLASQLDLVRGEIGGMTLAEMQGWKDSVLRNDRESYREVKLRRRAASVKEKEA